MKKLINGERYNQEIAMHAGYHLEITATETAYLLHFLRVWISLRFLFFSSFRTKKALHQDGL